ncbi:MAG TPA: FGGY family carbohydrate kinase, partial [Paenibacillus sp.]|nr:FGGY family carbohydrate kinase [Paenibacillus sp.]
MGNRNGNIPCVASVDIGTQGTKAALLTRGGDVLASAFVPSNLIRRSGGEVEQRPDDMLRECAGALAACTAARPDAAVEAVALSGQMAGVMGIDAAGDAATPYDSWLDTRCESQFERIRALGEAAVIAETGCPITYAHGPKALWWQRERPDVYARIAKFVVPTAYVAGRWTGGSAEDAYIDYTHLHFSGFADAASGGWSAALLSELKVEPSKLPRIVSPWDRVGGMTAAWADACGLREGTP